MKRGTTRVTLDETPQWKEPIKSWLTWLAADGTTEAGLYLREYQLRRFAGVMHPRGPWEPTTDDLASWMSSQDWSRETLRSYRAALRSFYGWAHSSGLVEQDPARLLRKVPVRAAKPRPIAEAALERVTRRADDRQHLALMLGSRAGLRRGEIARVHTDDLIREPGGFSLVVHGKGGRTRVVPLLDEIAVAIREHPPGWLFPNGHGTHITPAHMGKILGRVLEKEAVPHQLRHRFASVAYQRTRDIRAVQELLGHASVATTQIYTAVGDQSLRDAVRSAAKTYA